LSEQLQLRRGTGAQLAAFTPQAGELVVDTTNNRLVVGDGATAGGFPAAKLAETPLATNALNTLASGANGANLQFGVLEFLVSGLSGATVTPEIFATKPYPISRFFQSKWMPKPSARLGAKPPAWPSATA